jgi:hypothetical protein
MHTLKYPPHSEQLSVALGWALDFSILTDSALPLTTFGLGYAISLVVDAGATNALANRWQSVNIIFTTLYYSLQ